MGGDVLMICNKCGYIMEDDMGERGYVCDPPHMIVLSWYKCSRCGYERALEVDLNEERS